MCASSMPKTSIVSRMDPTGGIYQECAQCGDDIYNGCVCQRNESLREEFWRERMSEGRRN